MVLTSSQEKRGKREVSLSSWTQWICSIKIYAPKIKKKIDHSVYLYINFFPEN